MNSITVIEVSGKEWFDKYYGNSYCSFRIVVHYSDKSTISIRVPFQYGGSSSFLQYANEELKKSGIISSNAYSLYGYCAANGIVLVSHLQDKCLKRDVVAYGKGD